MRLQEKDYREIYISSIGKDVFRIYEEVLYKLKSCHHLEIIEEFLAAFKYLSEEKRIRIFSYIEFGDKKV